jgi:hypothetical protein
MAVIEGAMVDKEKGDGREREVVSGGDNKNCQVGGRPLSPVAKPPKIVDSWYDVRACCLQITTHVFDLYDF